MNVRQASRRVLQLRPVAVAVGIPLDEAEEDPQRRCIRDDIAVAGLGDNDFRRRDAAAPKVVLEIELEPDPIPAGIAPAATEHVPRAARIIHKDVHVPGAAGQRPDEPGLR